ncbi:O-antigen ligase family protein [Croceitalea marina]|uniref:O-antigen ligase family protein n=1 Tax=Croceitalea marina TaxID=1775166 RepID=A0ABW5N1B4_9FLAO
MKFSQQLSIKEVLLIILVILSIHFTEFKIGVVKLSEIILLFLPPFLYSRKINKWCLYFYFLFSLWLGVSLFFNIYREFPPLKGLSILKKPYLITIGRFFELIACINLVALIIFYFKNKSHEKLIQFVERIVFISFILIIINSLIYVLVINGIISNSDLVYITFSNDYRLKGGFVEGGPYGLMLSFVFVLSFWYKSRLNIIIRLFIIFNIIFFAKSKAGMLLLVIWGVIYYYKTVYRKIKSLSFIVLLIGGVIAIFAFAKLANVYIEHIQNMEKYVSERPNDTSLIMGRIAGSHIAPKMVLENPIFGIGLGNYPLQRNLKKYRSFIPESPPGKTDAHGLGGIFQLMVDGGIFILFSFILILIYLIKKTMVLRNGMEIFLFVFPCFFLTGVQIYFLYPWFLLGIIISLNEKADSKRRFSS